MDVIELRDLDAARRYVAEGLCLQRVSVATTATVRPVLEWAMEIAASGDPLPPVGFVADVANIAFGADPRPKDARAVPGFDPTLGRMYEDYLLAKFYADWTFERAADALRALQGKDRVKALAYVVRQVRERAGIGGVRLTPAVIRGLLTANPDEVLTAAWDGLTRDGPAPLHAAQYRELVAAGRRMDEVLVKEDVAAIEDRSALGDMGQYVSLRQIRQSAARLLARLPARPVRPLAGRKEVPTRILDEDQYPVGGYTSIATKGSMESLLHSQLAYMEDASAEPDLFDIKFARDELFYYSRDENQFLRRRRAFVFVLFPDLIAARFKDPELPAQRIILVQSAVAALVARLTEWLSTDAIRFEVVFVQTRDRRPLADEAALAEMLLRGPIARGDGLVAHVADRAAAAAHLNQLARTAQVHCLAVAADPVEFDLETVGVTRLVVAGPRPQVGGGDGVVAELDGDDAFDVWVETLKRVLALWV